MKKLVLRETHQLVWGHTASKQFPNDLKLKPMSLSIMPYLFYLFSISGIKSDLRMFLRFLKYCTSSGKRKRHFVIIVKFCITSFLSTRHVCLTASPRRILRMCWAGGDTHNSAMWTILVSQVFPNTSPWQEVGRRRRWPVLLGHTRNTWWAQDTSVLWHWSCGVGLVHALIIPAVFMISLPGRGTAVLCQPWTQLWSIDIKSENEQRITGQGS